MTLNLPNELKIDYGYKGVHSVLSTDPCAKNLWEEDRGRPTTLDSKDIYADEIPYNDVSGAITSGIILDYTGINRQPFVDDVSVGGAYRGFYVSGNIKDWLQNHKYGDDYAPQFYYTGVSGDVQIPSGIFWEYANFNYKNGYITLVKNATTDAWVRPIKIDGYVYNGRFLNTYISETQTILNQLIISGVLNSGLTVKAGTVAGASFTGSPQSLTYDVVFDSPFPDNTYSPTVIGEDNRSWSVENKTASGFTIDSNSRRPLVGEIYWVAVDEQQSDLEALTLKETTEPTVNSGEAKIFLDISDGDLKVKFGNGTVTTLASN